MNSTETPGKKKFDRKKLITAYILFSADVSESFCSSNDDDENDDCDDDDDDKDDLRKADHRMHSLLP